MSRRLPKCSPEHRYYPTLDRVYGTGAWRAYCYECDVMIIMIIANTRDRALDLFEAISLELRAKGFPANYSQKESERLGLGLRFIALAPARIMADTAIGKAAVTAYSRYLGFSVSEFLSGMTDAQTPPMIFDVLRGLNIQACADGPAGWWKG